jgi:hypothetical protein
MTIRKMMLKIQQLIKCGNIEKAILPTVADIYSFPKIKK